MDGEGRFRRAAPTRLRLAEAKNIPRVHSDEFVPRVERAASARWFLCQRLQRDWQGSPSCSKTIPLYVDYVGAAFREIQGQGRRNNPTQIMKL